MPGPPAWPPRWGGLPRRGPVNRRRGISVSSRRGWGPAPLKKRIMPARVLDGTLVAHQIRAEVGPAVAAFAARSGRPPGLGIVLVGDSPASEIYVRNKL